MEKGWSWGSSSVSVTRAWGSSGPVQRCELTVAGEVLQLGTWLSAAFFPFAPPHSQVKELVALGGEPCSA